MRIRTLHIRGYRHFNDVVIHDLGDINVFAGPNNAGKTSLLRAVRETLNFGTQGIRIQARHEALSWNSGCPWNRVPESATHTATTNAPAPQDLSPRPNPMVDDHLKLWVTKAYEIEQYYPRELLTEVWSAEVVSKLFDDPGASARPFYQVLKEADERGTRSADQRKVEYARRAVQRTPSGSKLAATWFQNEIGESLRTEVERLAAFIRRANGLPEAPTGDAQPHGEG